MHPKQLDSRGSSEAVLVGVHAVSSVTIRVALWQHYGLQTGVYSAVVDT